MNGLFLLRLSGERNLFGLAPGGVYLAAPIAQGTGELLPHLFTLIPTFAETVCFLWHFPYPRPVEPGTVRVTDHPALWSSDFPLLLIAPVLRDLRRSDHLFPVNSPPFLFPLPSSSESSSAPNNLLPLPGSPWRSYPCVAPRASPTVSPCHILRRQGFAGLSASNKIRRSFNISA